RLMIVEAEESRFRKRLRHQDDRRAVTASDVRDARAAFEFFFDAVERGNPLCHQVHRVAGAEEALGAAEQTRVVLMPAHATAVAKGARDFGLVADGSGGNLVD